MQNNIMLNFNKITEEIPVGLIILDSEMNIVFSNKQVEAFCGLAREKMIGKNIDILGLTNENNENIIEAFTHCLKNQQGIKNNFYLKCKDKTILVFIHTNFVENNGQSLIILTINDVSSIIECSRQNEPKDSKIEFLQRTIIGKDEKIKSLYKMIELASESLANVLIYGESGTGKELVAKSIHFLSDRKNKPFITVNCSALSETLLESELFGHVKGSFTGAYKDKIGKFEAAEGGTIFLDEIGDISSSIQLKLLRVIQEKTVSRVGDNKEIKVDMRIITATNKNLRELVAEEKFREDLFYRLNVFPVYTSALRERINDIPLLCDHLIDKFNKKNLKNIKGLSEDALRLLFDYCWPGNVRELENCIEHAFVVCANDKIDIFDLPQELRQISLRKSICKEEVVRSTENLNNNNSKEIKARNLVTKNELLELLAGNNWNKAETARQLGISRVALWKKIKKFEIK